MEHRLLSVWSAGVQHIQSTHVIPLRQRDGGGLSRESHCGCEFVRHFEEVFDVSSRDQYGMSGSGNRRHACRALHGPQAPTRAPVRRSRLPRYGPRQPLTRAGRGDDCRQRSRGPRATYESRKPRSDRLLQGKEVDRDRSADSHCRTWHQLLRARDGKAPRVALDRSDPAYSSALGGSIMVSTKIVLRPIALGRHSANLILVL